MTTIEGNKLIDIFYTGRIPLNGLLLGRKRGSEGHENYYDIIDITELSYHKDWNELIRVVRKIKYGDPNSKETFIVKNEISHPSTVRYKAITNSLMNLSIEQTHTCVIKFITWFNSLKKPR